MIRPKRTTAVLAGAALVAAVLPGASAQAAATAAAGVTITFENSGKCMNVSGASTANGAKIVQYTCSTAGTNDRWVLVPKGNESYWVQGVGSGKCLAVTNASTANNATLIQYTCNTGLNELWYVDSLFDGPTMRLVNVNSGKCVNVPNRSADNNVNLVQYTCDPKVGSTNERVFTPPATSATVTHRAFTTKQPVAVLQGGAVTSDGTAPVSYSWIDGTNQLNILTDYNPDVITPDPDAPAPSITTTDPTTDYGYTGRPTAGLLAGKRVEVAAHDASSGDVVYDDESSTGAGQYPYIYDIGGAMASQPVLGPTGTGTLGFYAIINGALWVNRETAGNAQAPYAGWRTLAGTGLTGTPAVAPSASGGQVFARTTAGAVQTATLTGGTLSDWTSLGGTGLGDPVVLPLKGNLTLVLARAADGSVVYKEQQAGGTWPADWSTIAGLASAGQPSAVIGSADGRIDVAIRGTDNLIYVAQETAAGSGQFGGWVQVFDPTTAGSAAGSDPTAFGYNVHSGQSFGIAFQLADPDVEGPWVLSFAPGWNANPPAASVSRAAKARSGLHGRPLPQPKKKTLITRK